MLSAVLSSSSWLCRPRALANPFGFALTADKNSFTKSMVHVKVSVDRRTIQPSHRQQLLFLSIRSLSINWLNSNFGQKQSLRNFSMVRKIMNEKCSTLTVGWFVEGVMAVCVLHWNRCPWRHFRCERCDV